MKTTRFWFTLSSGRLEAGKRLQWDWEMFGASADVTGKVVDAPRRIVFEWGAPGSRTEVEITFDEHGPGMTYTNVRVSGFAGDPAGVERQRVDAMDQFSLVLAGAKAVLEHNIDLNLVADRYPDRRG